MPTASAPPAAPLPPQNIPVDSLVVKDSVVTARRDTSDALGNIGREVGEAGRLLVDGQWETVLDRMSAAFVALLVDFVPVVIGATFVFLLFYGVFRIVKVLLARVLHRSKRIDAGLESLLMKLYKITGWTLIGIMVLAQFGVNVTALVTGLGIIGIAIGFAARDTLENFISGITILMDRPFRIGDMVDVDGVYGTVEEITLRSTRIRTLQNQIMVMPNVQMINQRLNNHTMLGILRVDVPFGIAYKEYPEEARKIVLKAVENDTRLHPDFEPTVVVTGLGDSSVDMVLRVFLKNPRQEVMMRFELVERIREALREADIEIPFPHLQLFVDEAKAFEGTQLMLPPGTPPGEPGDAPSERSEPTA
jgi:small conductance mechanosensitive channel